MTTRVLKLKPEPVPAGSVPCPSCGIVPEFFVALIQEGTGYDDGIVSYKNPDFVVGHTLLPCNHTVPGFVAMRKDGEPAW